MKKEAITIQDKENEKESVLMFLKETNFSNFKLIPKKKDDFSVKINDRPQVAGRNFLLTNSLFGERQYPRNKAGKVKPPPISFMEEQGYVKNGSIGPSTAVGVVGPRVKKLVFYDWESKLTHA